MGCVYVAGMGLALDCKAGRAKCKRGVPRRATTKGLGGGCSSRSCGAEATETRGWAGDGGLELEGRSLHGEE